eukprot:gene10651-biopygen7783
MRMLGSGWGSRTGRVRSHPTRVMGVSRLPPCAERSPPQHVRTSLPNSVASKVIESDTHRPTDREPRSRSPSISLDQVCGDPTLRSCQLQRAKPTPVTEAQTIARAPDHTTPCLKKLISCRRRGRGCAGRRGGAVPARPLLAPLLLLALVLEHVQGETAAEASRTHGCERKKTRTGATRAHPQPSLPPHMQARARAAGGAAAVEERHAARRHGGEHLPFALALAAPQHLVRLARPRHCCGPPRHP